MAMSKPVPSFPLSIPTTGRRNLTALAAVVLSCATMAQAPSIQWQLCIGGSAEDQLHSVIQRSEGGYLAVGATQSSNGDVGANLGGYDLLVAAVSANGTLEWVETYGGPGNDEAFSVVPVSGGYMIAGHTSSLTGDVNGNHGMYDAWLIRIDLTGQLLWQRAYGGSYFEGAKCLRGTPDGGMVFCGYASSNDGDVSGVDTSNPNCNLSCDDVWVVKLDAAGNIEWQSATGGSDIDVGYGVARTADGGYSVSGVTVSLDGDVSDPNGQENLWVVQLGSTGTLLGEHSFGGTDFQQGRDILAPDDSTVVFCGQTTSTDGDVVGQNGDYDRWVVRMRNDGTLLWQLPLGGTNEETADGIIRAADGSYVACGYAGSADGDVVGVNWPSVDAWLTGITPNGTLAWQLAFGGTEGEFARELKQTTDLGFIVTGATYSNDGDVSGNHGDFDGWLVKLSAVPVGVAEGVAAPNISVYQPANEQCIMVSGADLSRCNAVRVVDGLGRVLHAERPMGTTMRIDMRACARGVYCVEAISGTTKRTERLVLR